MSADIERWGPPNDPTSFESLCLDLWRDIWRDQAQKNGRSGQPQAGVDVYGQHQGQWVGVQCKQKDGLLRRKLTIRELDEEVAAARYFKPSLSTFILATTGPRDAAVQQRARELTEAHKKPGLFAVEIWSWDDIWPELYGREALLKRIAPLYWPRLSGLGLFRGQTIEGRVSRSPRQGPPTPLSNRKAATEYLTKWLRRDQDSRGVHRGEFGKHAPIREERRFQIVQDDFATKPRLYLTGWPCFIFHELGIGERELSLAITGVKRQLATGSIQTRATVPSHPEHLPTVANIRHTFRALQILHRLRPSEPIVVRLIGDVLDHSRRSLQQQDGGWPHFASGKKSDLWATTYGTALLNDVEKARTPSATDNSHAGALLREALVFLKHEWNRSRWAYAEASSAHNAIQIYHELAPALARVDADFLKELFAWVLHWITPSGNLSQTYIEDCGHVTWPSGNARIAYAIFQHSPTDQRWRLLFEEAMREIEVGVNAADAAFLLHMDQYY